ncbi:MAG: hypothetical protein EKK53_23205 [Burkholderiales bacterium]|nr:MAG: hypothetical protein EKK53_23205 [Burkholderiales bacterium]
MPLEQDPKLGETPSQRPEVGEMWRDVSNAVKQSSRREPYPLPAAGCATLAVWMAPGRPA